MQELNDRPDIDEIMTSYDGMLADMREALNAEFPGGTWRSEGERTTSLARITDDLTTVSRGWSQTWVFDRSVADDDETKSRALAALNGVGGRHGFVDLVVFVDRHGELEAVADDEYGGRYYLGSQKFTTLRYATAYHRPAES